MATIPEELTQHYLMAAMEVVLLHAAQFSIEINCELWLDRLEDGRFRVLRYASNMRTILEEHLFDDVKLAIAFFLERRTELKLGMDLEAAP